MTPKISPERRRGDRRVRQVYHDVERRDPRRASDPRRKAVERDHPSTTLWLAVLLLVLALVDAFVWDGYYRQSLWIWVHEMARSTQAWSNGLWGGAGV